MASDIYVSVVLIICSQYMHRASMIKMLFCTTQLLKSIYFHRYCTAELQSLCGKAHKALSAISLCTTHRQLRPLRMAVVAAMAAALAIRQQMERRPAQPQQLLLRQQRQQQRHFRLRLAPQQVAERWPVNNCCVHAVATRSERSESQRVR